MKLFLLLLLTGCTYVGGGVESHRNGSVVSFEGENLSFLVIDRPYDGIGVVPLVIVHKTFGSRFYVKPGIGLTTANKMNSALNFCPSVGFKSKIKVELVHCSNGGLDGLNYGLDFITVSVSF